MNLITRRRVSASLAVVLSTGILGLASHALAASNAAGTMPVTFGAETWYQPDPTCMLPTGCVSAGVTPPPVNPYGAGTLHVSVSAGEETARTYLAINSVVLGAGVTISKATFTAPLDTTATTGSTMPETSTTHVCSATGPITATEGEFDSPPSTTSCQTDAALTYSATPTAELTGDLTDLVNAHLSDLAAGKLDLAILPLNAPQTAAWHDVFDSNDGASKATTPTLNLTFASADDSAPVVVATPSDSPSPTDSPTAEVSAVAVKPVSPGKPVPVTSAAPVTVVPAPVAAAAPPAAVVPAPVAAIASTAPAPQVATAAPVTGQAVGQAPVQAVQTVASTRTVGFAYPAVLLLPLLLIAGGAGLARIMTRDVSPTSDR